MDHPSSLRRDSPWRTRAMVAAAFAALELVLLVAVAAALVGKPFLAPGEATPAPRAEAGGATKANAKPAAVPKLARGETLVIVLNGNGSAGAASDTAALVQSQGYLIAGTANAPRTDFARSLVMFRPGFQGEADRLARDFRVSRVAPLDGLRPAELQGAHVALIVGRS
jgi:LytR cell envelope-related transcriptional attenuator